VGCPSSTETPRPPRRSCRSSRRSLSIIAPPGAMPVPRAHPVAPVRAIGAALENERMPTGATDFDIPTLRARRTNKWHKFPDDVLPAWSPTWISASPVGHCRMKRLTTTRIRLCGAQGVLAASFARRMERRFGWTVDPPTWWRSATWCRRRFRRHAFSEPGDGSCCNCRRTRRSWRRSTIPAAACWPTRCATTARAGCWTWRL